MNCTVEEFDNGLSITLPVVQGLARAAGVTPSSMLVPFENTIIIDKRSHLEVLDARHRYSKNLRAYYALWKSLSPHPFVDSGAGPSAEPGDICVDGSAEFFRWIDSPDVVELPECPLQKLNSDVVTYFNEEERRSYIVDIDPDGLFRSAQGHCLLSTGPAGWIFVIRNYIIYAAQKITSSPRLHHSSFLAGLSVQAAGVFMVEEGRLVKLYAHSGHYRPTEKHVYQLLNHLKSQNVNLDDVLVDAQRIIKISREKEPGVKEKKMTTSAMWLAPLMLNFLKHKCLYERLAMDAVLHRSQASPARPAGRPPQHKTRSEVAPTASDENSLTCNATLIVPATQVSEEDSAFLPVPDHARLTSTDSIFNDFDSLRNPAALARSQAEADGVIDDS